MQASAENPFLAVALAEIPRLLGQLNRNPASRTYGSFDRAYWHYRTNDISCARYQEAAYTLALLYASPFAGNSYHRDAKTFELIRASLRFTASLQKKDGSFDEWYPFEGSYVATAFVAAALAQTIALFRKEHIELPEEARVMTMLERAADFLVASEERTVMNQVSGAVFAIAAVGRLTDQKKLVVAADQLLGRFLAEQHEEGWWSEYGGPDAGYLSLTISYLEKYQGLRGAVEIPGAIQKARAFLEQFIHPDGTAGGEYMARNTEYLIPSSALPYLGAVRPAHLDDRYLCYTLYNWIETGLRTEPQTMSVPFGEQYYSESALLRVATDRYMLVANGTKGGSFRLYAGDKVYYDSGLEVSTGATNLSTGVLDVGNAVTFETGKLVASGSLKAIKEPLMSTLVAIVFKSWQLTAGRFAFSRTLIKDFLRPRMVSYAGSSDSTFERVIAYAPGRITISDRVHGPAAAHGILAGSKAAYTAVPSSKYAATPQLQSHLLVPHIETDQAGENYTLRRTFTFPA